MKKILLLSLIFIVSCTTIKEVPVEVVKTEYITTHTVDTFIKENTKYIKEKGDTIFIYEKEYVYKYKDRVDTLIVNDTINTTKYVDRVEYIEVNKLKDWQIFLIVLGGGFILLLIYKLYNKFKK